MGNRKSSARGTARFAKETRTTVRVGSVHSSAAGAGPVVETKVSAAALRGVEGVPVLVAEYAKWYPDRFAITLLELPDKRRGCAALLLTRRTDSPSGWGQDLVVELVSAPERQGSAFQDDVVQRRVLEREWHACPAGGTNSLIDLQFDVHEDALETTELYCKAQGSQLGIIAFVDRATRKAYAISMLDSSPLPAGTSIACRLLRPLPEAPSAAQSQHLFGSDWARARIADFDGSEEGIASLRRSEFSVAENGHLGLATVTILSRSGKPTSIIMRAWTAPTRRLPVEFAPAAAKCGLSPAGLALDPFGQARRVLEQAAAAAGFDAANGLQNFARRAQCPASLLVSFSRDEELGQHCELVVPALAILAARSSDDSQLYSLGDLIQKSMRMCGAQKLDCFHAVAEAACEAAKAKGTAPVTPAERLHEALAAKLGLLKERAFLLTFVVPCEAFYRSHIFRETEYGDMRVHGRNVFRALLLAAIGAIGDREAMFFDDAKAAALFHSAPCFQKHVLAFWDAQFQGQPFAWPALYCRGEACEIPALNGFGTAFGVANAMLSPGGELIRQLFVPYIDTFCSMLSLDRVLLPLLNLALSDGLKRDTAEVVGVPLDDIYAHFYTPDDEDCTVYRVSHPAVLDLLSTRLGLLRAPQAGTA